MNSSLNEALDRLKEDMEAEVRPFPLWALLTIYCKAEQECYVNYMEGFIALAKWLGPVEHSIIDIDYDKLPLSNYEMQRMATILNMPENFVVYTFIHEVLPKLNTNLGVDLNDLT